MSEALRGEILAILQEGRDLTLATLRPDGAPQATTVSYASQGLTIFFGCSSNSQKAHNLARDDRVSLTIDLPYADWTQIRGLSLSGRARPVKDAQALDQVGQRFLAKFPEAAQYVAGNEALIALYQITPELISVLDYRKGFGHTELVRVAGAAGEGRIEKVA